MVEPERTTLLEKPLKSPRRATPEQSQSSSITTPSHSTTAVNSNRLSQLDSSGRLKAVTSTGPSDSLFERRVIKYAGDYDWTSFDSSKTIQINGEEITFCEYTDFPHEYAVDNSTIVRFYTDDPKLGELEIRKENGQYICPKMGLEYHCTGNRIGIIGSYWPSIWDTISIEADVKFESNLGYEVITPITNTPIQASNINIKHEAGIDEFTVSYENTKMVKKTVNDKDVNYLYFINLPEIPDYAMQLFNFILPSTMMDAEKNPFNDAASSILGNGHFAVPVFINNEEDTTFTKKLSEFTEGPGIAIDTKYETPMNMLLRGELFVEWLPRPSHSLFASSVKCKYIDADNALQLFRTPVPFIYTPREFGEETIDGHDYWFIDWGFDSNSDEFKQLVDGQPFEFHDNAFGHRFILSKSGTKWSGNNVHIHVNDVANVATDYAVGSHQDANIVKVYFKNDATMRSWFKLLCGWTDANESSMSIAEFVQTHQLLSIDFEGKPVTWSSASYETATVNDVQYSVLKTSKTSHNLSHSGHGNLNYHIKYWADAEEKTFTYSNEGLYEPSQTGIVEGTLYQHNVPLISGFKIDHSYTVGDRSVLKLYIHKGFFFRINDNDYKDGTNPFTFLASTNDYSVIPRPENCSTLMTSYNIQTTGIVIGANIESHEFTINNLGNSVSVITNDLDYTMKVLQQLVAEVEALTKQFDNYIMMDMIFGFAEGVAGAVGGIIQAGTKGAFKFGEKEFAKIAEETGKIEMKETKFVEGIETNLIKSTEKIEMDSSKGMKIIGPEGNEFEMTTEGTTFLGPVNFEDCRFSKSCEFSDVARFKEVIGENGNFTGKVMFKDVEMETIGAEGSIVDVFSDLNVSGAPRLESSEARNADKS